MRCWCLLIGILCWTVQAADLADVEAFRNPAAVRSPSYFWIWNAPLERDTLDAQLGEMAANGLQSVCPHPFPAEFRPNACRSAMQPGYLTPGFMDAFVGTVRRARELGMNVWLYDEGGWPSGLACGQVVASDRAEGRFCTRYLERDPQSGEIMLRTARYGGKCWGNFPSLLEPGATERFLELTHERYAAACGDEFGKTIRFAFTDEPTRPHNLPDKVVWVSDFDEQFCARKGYDIRPYAASLLKGTNITAEADSNVRVDYEDVMSQLFVERYMRPVGAWCRAHGLKSGGHVEGEDTPGLATRYGCGSVLRNLRELDVPGVDTIWRQLFPRVGPAEGAVRPFPRYAASVAHQKGGNDVLSESFCIYGDSLAPEQMKWVVDSQLVRGVTVFVFGYYALSNAGQWMTLFEPHSGPVQPYWEFQKPFFRYVHRMCGLLARGRSVSEIAVVYDIRDFWACGNDCRRAVQAHFAVAEGLDRRNCDYDFVDDDQISAAVVSGSRIQIGRQAYSTVVLPYSRRLLPAARDKLESFRSAGGRVLAADELDQAPRTVRLSGEGAEDIRVLKRMDGQSAVYFLHNETATPKKVKIALDEGSVAVCRADPETGDFVTVNGRGDGFFWEFPSFGSVAFVTGVERAERVESVVRRLPVVGWTARKTMEIVPGRTDFIVSRVKSQIANHKSQILSAVSLGDWRATFGDRFSGRVCYRATFDSERASRVKIDLGTVKGAVRVTLNGKEVGVRFFGPYVFESSAVGGENVLEVEVANTLANALSSDEVRERIARDFPPLSSYDRRQRPFDREFNESGLYGPVTVSSIVESAHRGEACERRILPMLRR